MDDDSRSYSNTSCTTTITGLERFAELSMLQKDSILVRHSKEAAALPSTETKRAWIQAKLNALFGIDLKNNLLSHRVSIGDAIASCQAEITGTIFPKYAAYLHVHIVQSIKTCISYTRSVVFRLPINDRDREPKLIPFFQVDDETGIVSDGLKRMIAMFNVGWLPILKALYSITKWDHAIVVNSYFGVSQDTYRWFFAIFLRLMAFITGAQLRPSVEVLHEHSSDSDEDKIIEIYPVLRGFHVLGYHKMLECQRQIDLFHYEMRDVLKVVIHNNSTYGIHLRQTRFGIGAFNGAHAITNKRKEPIAIYMCAISTAAQFHHDRDYTYGFGDTKLCGVSCVFDGKFTVSNRKPYNGIYFNHSCTPNCYVTEVIEDVTKITYLLFYPRKPIDSCHELTIDYNDGIKTDKFGRQLEFGYWNNIHTLKLTGHYKKYLVKCGCNDGKCPKNRGFDLRYIRPDEAAELSLDE